MWAQSLGREDPLEEGMETHSSIFAWRIPRTEEPGGLQSMGSERVRQDCTHTYTTPRCITGCASLGAVYAQEILTE